MRLSLIHISCAYRRENRYQTPEEFREALEAVRYQEQKTPVKHTEEPEKTENAKKTQIREKERKPVSEKVHYGEPEPGGTIVLRQDVYKRQTELTAEERLLRAIFGEKAREVRDTSLKVPHGEYGIIVDAKVFTRENGDELSPGVNQSVRIYIAQKRKISVGDLSLLYI